jgi:hypothetical protein
MLSVRQLGALLALPIPLLVLGLRLAPAAMGHLLR